VVRNAVLMGGTVVGPGAVVERAVVDKNVIIGSEARVGDLQADVSAGEAGLEGIAVLGKWARVSDGDRVLPGTSMPARPPMAQDMIGRAMEAFQP